MRWAKRPPANPKTSGRGRGWRLATGGWRVEIGDGRVEGGGGLPDSAEHPEGDEVQGDEGDEAREAKVESSLEEFVVGVGDVGVGRDEEEGVEDVDDVTEGVHAHAGEREILNRVERARPVSDAAFGRVDRGVGAPEEVAPDHAAQDSIRAASGQHND